MDIILEYMPQAIKNIPTHMDFEGQKRAERLFQVIIVAFSVVGFAWGFISQQFSHTMYVLFVGLVISCLLTLPPWPLYRNKPVKWQKPQDVDESATASDKSPNEKAKKTPKSKKNKKAE